MEWNLCFIIAKRFRQIGILNVRQQNMTDMVSLHVRGKILGNLVALSLSTK